jgi:hypothetical protein
MRLETILASLYRHFRTLRREAGYRFVSVAYEENDPHGDCLEATQKGLLVHTVFLAVDSLRRDYLSPETIAFVRDPLASSSFSAHT